ncbi:Regulator of nonsense transcripts upf2 [Orobanche gracilis]
MELDKRLQKIVDLRLANQNPDRPGHAMLANRPNKHNPHQLTKNLRTVNAFNFEKQMDRLDQVNLGPRVSDAVKYISETEYEISDIPAAGEVCSCLHQTYEEFSKNLVDALLAKCFFMKSKKDKDRRGETWKMTESSKRSSMNLLFELFYIGVVTDFSCFPRILMNLSYKPDSEHEDSENTHLALIESFATQAKYFIIRGEPGDHLKEVKNLVII